jgi:hypothetical protein
MAPVKPSLDRLSLATSKAEPNIAPVARPIRLSVRMSVEPPAPAEKRL